MRRRRLGGAALAGLPILFLLHNDFWLWDDPRRIAGLPVGLLYHVIYCAAASGLMALLVAFAWPAHLEAGDRSAARDRPR